MSKKHRLIAGIAAVALVGTGLAMGGTAMASSAPSSAPSAVAPLSDAAEDGRALFSGLFFAHGPVGEALATQLRFSDPEGLLERNKSRKGRQAIASIEKAVEAASPGFFADFSRKIRSGDPRLVDQALHGAGAVLERAAEEVDETIPDGTGQALLVFNVVMAVNISHAVNVIVVAAVAFEIAFWEMPHEVYLDRDEAVADLTKLLRTI